MEYWETGLESLEGGGGTRRRVGVDLVTSSEELSLRMYALLGGRAGAERRDSVEGLAKRGGRGGPDAAVAATEACIGDLLGSVGGEVGLSSTSRSFDGVLNPLVECWMTVVSWDPTSRERGGS